nr:unnamed protein product [Callosobruchus analis]
MGDKKEWLKSEIVDLIDIYHKKPELWDVESKLYNSKTRKQVALGEIAEKFQTRIDEVKRKIHNLRNQFKSELKKIKTKSSPDDVYSPKWPYFKSLLFLESSLTCNVQTGNTETDDVIDVEEENASDCEILFNIEDVPIIHQETSQKPRKKMKNNSEEYDVNIQKAIRALNKQDDQYDIFGAYVATELRGLSSEYLRRKLKRKFQRAILEIAEEEEYLNADVTIVSSNPAASAVHFCQHCQQPLSQKL